MLAICFWSDPRAVPALERSLDWRPPEGPSQLRDFVVECQGLFCCINRYRDG